MTPDWQAITGLALNLMGALLIAASRNIMRPGMEATAFERLLAVFGKSADVPILRSGHTAPWSWGWTLMTAGYALQALSAYGLRVDRLILSDIR